MSYHFGCKVGRYSGRKQNLIIYNVYILVQVQRETARKDVVWTNKVVVCGGSDRDTGRKREIEMRDGHDRLGQRTGYPSIR